MRPMTGIVLCGGLSSRMGSDKALLKAGGTTLLSRVVGRLRPVTDPILLAAGTRPLRHEGCLTVADMQAGRGPMGGLVAGLERSPHDLSAVVAVDMPDVDASLLTMLCNQWDGEDALIPLGPGGPEPLHGVYAQSALATARDLLTGPNVSMRTLLDSIRVRYVTAENIDFARNLNVPSDLTDWRSGR